VPLASPFSLDAAIPKTILKNDLFNYFFINLLICVILVEQGKNVCAIIVNYPNPITTNKKLQEKHHANCIHHLPLLPRRMLPGATLLLVTKKSQTTQK
jgi:hypothetical protein